MAFIHPKHSIEPHVFLGKTFIDPNLKIEPPFNIASLFENGGQGFFIDPSDLDTMYQDALMQEKVTANNQTVQRIAPVNSKDTWTKLDLLVTEFASVPIGGSAFNQVRIHNTIKAGQRYKLKFKVRNYAGSGDVGYVGAAFRRAVDGIATIAVNSNGAYEFEAIGYTAGQATIYTRDVNQAEFYDIEIHEYSDLQPYQYTSSQRPIYRDKYLEFDGIDDFLTLPLFQLPHPFTVMMAFESVKLSGTQALFSSGQSGYLMVASNGLNLGTQQNTGNPVIYQPKDLVDVVSHRAENGIVTLKTNKGQISSSELVANSPYSAATQKYIGNFNNASFSTAAGIKLYAMLVINRALTDEEEAAVRKEFNKRMGIV